MIINYSNSPYEFDVDEYGVPAFTKKNIAFLNGILKYDSNYSTSTDENNEDIQPYSTTQCWNFLLSTTAKNTTFVSPSPDVD